MLQYLIVLLILASIVTKVYEGINKTVKKNSAIKPLKSTRKKEVRPVKRVRVKKSQNQGQSKATNRKTKYTKTSQSKIDPITATSKSKKKTAKNRKKPSKKRLAGKDLVIAYELMSGPMAKRKRKFRF